MFDPDIHLDLQSACSGEWCWYVVTCANDDGEIDGRAVPREGEHRIYFDSLPALLAEHDIDQPANLLRSIARDL